MAIPHWKRLILVPIENRVVIGPGTVDADARASGLLLNIRAVYPGAGSLPIPAANGQAASVSR